MPLTRGRSVRFGGLLHRDSFEAGSFGSRPRLFHRPTTGGQRPAPAIASHSLTAVLAFAGSLVAKPTRTSAPAMPIGTAASMLTPASASLRAILASDPG